ncbi:hypothetical protein AAFC00_001801 [Neodothiora populina]|uniref:Uncharacterized protein n=1 Tax=Neodothiora populina TaxID=2781224 RepID=A0ABR3PQ72_9PEZI
MAWNLDDRWLWLGLGALTFVAVKGIAYGLQDTLKLVELPEPANETSNENSAEDSISLESLRTLAASPNPDIANAAISLLVSRFASSDTACDKLTLEIFSSSSETRSRAKQMLDILDNYPLPTDFPKPDVLRVERVREYQESHRTNERVHRMCMAFYKAMNQLQHGSDSHREVAEAVEKALLGLDVAHRRGMMTTTTTARWHGGGGGGGVGAHDDDDDQDDDQDDDPFSGLYHSVESLDEILARAGSSSHPIRLPTAALSALLHEHSDSELSNPSLVRSDRSVMTAATATEESPEEAEMRRRRNRAARVMEIAEDYIIV